MTLPWDLPLNPTCWDIDTAFPGIGIPFVGTDSTKCRGSRTWTWWGTNSVPSSTTGSSTSTTTIIGETESNTRIGTDRTGKSTRNTIATS
mmetsp:Transcript_15983/g.15978  ORF Transcript_15983/g.15978 Transcript_15983/m.15978 type:complete len:90 (+) Transcript_15983:707-976(+)